MLADRAIHSSVQPEGRVTRTDDRLSCAVRAIHPHLIRSAVSKATIRETLSPRGPALYIDC